MKKLLFILLSCLIIGKPLLSAEAPLSETIMETLKTQISLIPKDQENPVAISGTLDEVKSLIKQCNLDIAKINPEENWDKTDVLLPLLNLSHAVKRKDEIEKAEAAASVLENEIWKPIRLPRSLAKLTAQFITAE